MTRIERTCALAVLLCCGAALPAAAQDAPAVPGPAAPGPAVPAPVYSYARGDRILKFFNLTDEQAQKIDALHKETQQAISVLYKDAPKNDPEAMKRFQAQVAEKREAEAAALKAKITEVLNPEQKKKYQDADAVMEEFKTAMKTVQEMRDKAMEVRDAKLIAIFGDGFKEMIEKARVRPAPVLPAGR